MARKTGRRTKKVQFKIDLMIDSLIALVTVVFAPALINKLFLQANPITGTMATAAGVGATYLESMFSGRDNIVNVGIPAGVATLLMPVVENLLGVGTPIEQLPVKTITPGSEVAMNVADFIQLNEYLGVPKSAVPYKDFAKFYEN